jgi:putative phosphoribosyl transferase
VVVSRNSGTPFNPEFAIGAVMPEGSYFLNEVSDSINIRQDYIDSQIGEQAKEIDRWPINFRGSKR